MSTRSERIRVFEDKDFAWLRILNCLKNTHYLKNYLVFIDIKRQLFMRYY